MVTVHSYIYCMHLHIYSSIPGNTELYTFQAPGMWALRLNKSLFSRVLGNEQR